MSTGLNCHFFQWHQGLWYYLLERWDAPKMAWDWREFSDCYGPFEDRIAAGKHLSDNHANPGGSSTAVSSDLNDDVLSRLVGSATK